jgi:formamidopyrimidine-DNA glycosylase
MPELPDVEIFRQRFERAARGRTISEVRVLVNRLLDRVTPKKLTRALVGQRVVAAKRHGKHLFVELDDGSVLALHFGMTGEIAPLPKDRQPPRYTALHLVFDDGTSIAFTSRRRLGHVGLAKTAEAYIRSHDLGPDALDPKLDLQSFQAGLGSRRRVIKSALMDQSKLAGIGNIYSDEILFQAGLNPKRLIGDLGPPDTEGLFKAMRHVLQTAIKQGILAEEIEGAVPEDWLLPHRGKGCHCPRCGARLQATKIGGRTAWFCPSCQPS